MLRVESANNFGLQDRPTAAVRRVRPQGLLRGGNPGATTGYAESITREFLWLFGWNVGVSLIAIGANTLRSVNTPMGYVIETVQAPWYGAVWGTRSLAIGTGERIAPSLAVLVERSGPMEITAFVAIAQVAG